MPILSKSTSHYPHDLLQGRGLSDDARGWWALYTKARQEKRVAEQLLAMEVPFYLPLVPKQHMGQGRVRMAHVPVFTGYVFLFGTPEERQRALTTNRIVQTLPVGNGAELYRDLQQLELLIESKVPLTVESRIQPGQRVRVKQGSFAGVEGVVISRKRMSRLLVAVNFLQKGVSVELDDFMLEPL